MATSAYSKFEIGALDGSRRDQRQEEEEEPGTLLGDRAARCQGTGCWRGETILQEANLILVRCSDAAAVRKRQPRWFAEGAPGRWLLWATWQGRYPPRLEMYNALWREWGRNSPLSQD